MDTNILYSVGGVVVLLVILIFVHELGHFIVAKISGVGVLKFSLGFGPKLFGRRYGETEYIVSAIPLGGYVKMLGESDHDAISPEDEKRSFLKQKVSKRIAIVAAGPFFNLLFAVIFFWVGLHDRCADPYFRNWRHCERVPSPKRRVFRKKILLCASMTRR